MDTLEQRLFDIRRRIKATLDRCGRDPQSLKLVAVSKGQDTQKIREVFDAGQRVFGENYAQELAKKATQLSDLPIEWHFIGHLQRNKVNAITPFITCVETIDSIPLAKEINRRQSAIFPCLIEVNIGDESSKSGCAVGDVIPLAGAIASLPHLELMGLMVIPPFHPDPEMSRPPFRALRTLLERINREANLRTHLQELSMGMSHDFEVAIEEGATIVRIGQAIFGERER